MTEQDRDTLNRKLAEKMGQSVTNWCEKATPGPWHYDGRPWEENGLTNADARFIAESRTLLPRAVAEIQRLSSGADKHLAKLEQCINDFDKREAEYKKAQEEIASLKAALEESVKLQAHYAELLNMHDGGKRIVFQSTDDWLARMERIKDAMEKEVKP